MRIVSENTEAELARGRALNDAHVAVRRLAACLMRIVAGAGKPYEIEMHAADLLVACRDYRELEPRYPLSDDLARALDITTDFLVEGLSDRQAAWTSGIGRIREGALRMAAAQLLDQRVQVSNGQSRMFDGIRIIDQEREKNRAQAAKQGTHQPRRKPKL